MNRPVFWMHEVSGHMRAIVLKFFSETQPLTEQEIKTLKWYLSQWISALPSQPPRWRYLLRNCKTKQDLKKFNFDLLDYGIDPF